MNDLVTKAEETERSLGAVIDEVNARLYQLKATLSRAGVTGKPTVDKGDGGSTGGGSGDQSKNPMG